MLHGLQPARHATFKVVASSKKPCSICLKAYCCRSPLASRRSTPARFKTSTVQTRCFLASAVSHTSETGESVTEAIAKASLDKALFQHDLHSIFSSLIWFGLAWIITRYIGKKSKECESPEVSAVTLSMSNVHEPGCKLKISSACRSQHQVSWQSFHQLFLGSDAQFMSMQAKLCWWQ